jgi:hypothetical protein
MKLTNKESLCFLQKFKKLFVVRGQITEPKP